VSAVPCASKRLRLRPCVSCKLPMSWQRLVKWEHRIGKAIRAHRRWLPEGLKRLRSVVQARAVTIHSYFHLRPASKPGQNRPLC